MKQVERMIKYIENIEYFDGNLLQFGSLKALGDVKRFLRESENFMQPQFTEWPTEREREAING